MKSVTLKVSEAYTRDVGRNVARVDYDTMDSMNVSTNDFLLIKGKKQTIVKVLPLYPTDEGKGLIRLDGLVRENAGTAIGHNVTIVGAMPSTMVPFANNITVAYDDDSNPKNVEMRYLSDALESIAVNVGDKIMVPYFGGRVSFKIVSVDHGGLPKKPFVVVHQKTIFDLVTGPVNPTPFATLVRTKRTELMKRLDEVTNCGNIELIQKQGHQIIAEIDALDRINSEVLRIKGLKK